MKKSQRLRFCSLVNKQSKGEALSGAEAGELKQLSALVATHPNAADDTEDDKKDETDEEKKKREANEKKAEDDKKEEDDKKKKDDEAKAKAALKPGVSARLSAAMASLGGGMPAPAAAALKAEQTAHATTKADLTAAQSENSGLKSQVSGLTTALAAFCEFFGLKPAEVSGKTQADIDALCTAKIGAAAIEQVASIGFPATQLPTPSGEGKPSTKAELLAAYNALTDSGERAAFYAKHKAALFD